MLARAVLNLLIKNSAEPGDAAGDACNVELDCWLLSLRNSNFNWRGLITIAWIIHL